MRESAAGRDAGTRVHDRVLEHRRERERRRNIRLLVANGGLMMMAMTFVSSDLVLPAFVQTLTTSSIMVGLASAIMRIGWAWPQVFISRLVEPLPRKMPVFVIAGIVRTALWIAVGAATFMIGPSHPVTLLAVFMGIYALATSCMGITNVPWMDIIGKSVPASDRASMFALRRLVGGGGAVLSGAVISYLLSDAGGPDFPGNYGVLFILSGIGTGLSILAFASIHEPVERGNRKRQAFRAYLASGLLLLKEDLNYRRLCILQFLWAFTMMSTPFYVPFALTDLSLDPAFVGFFVTAMQISSIFSNLVWAYIGKRRGNHALLSMGTWFLALSILVPLTVDFVPSIALSGLPDLGTGQALDIRVLYYTLTFVFSGFATSGMFTGRMTYILDIAPADRRPTYTSFMNAFMLPQGILPIIGGTLVALISYRNMFLIALAFVPVAVWNARKLKDVRAD